MVSNLALDNPIIKRPGPAAVDYDLSQPGQVTITLPAGSTWSSGLHWHEKHIEYLRVVKGSVSVTLGSETRTVSAVDLETEVKVDRYVWHEWRRADPDGDEVVVVERTDPDDGEKTVFFWNLNGVILSVPDLVIPGYVPRILRGWYIEAWVTLSLFVIFHDLDNIPVFLDFRKTMHGRISSTGGRSAVSRLSERIDWLFSHIVLLVASYAAWILGLRAVRPEFTPERPFHRWMLTHSSKKRTKLS